ncbi:MAG TPA: hypothetical protein VNA13_01325 [Xanthomonadales bacterium]|nr:hypothetical protein [Xanthomonadales bacterium]
MNQLDLTDFFQTKEGALDFTSRLATISEELYKSDFNLEKTLLEQFGIQKKERFLSILRDNNIEIESIAAIKKLISDILEKVGAFPVLSLKLAFEPNEKTLKTISEWFILNIKKQVLLDISVDQNLIAGCDISFKGEYVNFSIKPKFDAIVKDALTNNHIVIPEEKPDSKPDSHHSSENFSIGR